jgi:hypothetical protein
MLAHHIGRFGARRSESTPWRALAQINEQVLEQLSRACDPNYLGLPHKVASRNRISTNLTHVPRARSSHDFC